jgi:uncharacterized protein YjbJ (UPF0337 family)
MPALRRNTMKSGNRDKVEGTFHELKGKAKEAAGRVTDNPNLETEGTVEKIGGQVQRNIGRVKKAFGK